MSARIHGAVEGARGGETERAGESARLDSNSPRRGSQKRGRGVTPPKGTTRVSWAGMPASTPNPLPYPRLPIRPRAGITGGGGEETHMAAVGKTTLGHRSRGRTWKDIDARREPRALGTSPPPVTKPPGSLQRVPRQARRESRRGEVSLGLGLRSRAVIPRGGASDRLSLSRRCGVSPAEARFSHAPAGNPPGPFRPIHAPTRGIVATSPPPSPNPHPCVVSR